MIVGAARDLFFPPGVRKQGLADADRAHASTLRKSVPWVWDSLVEAKMVTVTGCLPEPGSLEQQTGGLKATLEWLAEAGILEWVNRSASLGA